MMSPERVQAIFKMLMEHPATWNLIDNLAVRFNRPEVVEYLFDGYMPCLLIEEDGKIIDAQDFSYEMLEEGEDYSAYRKFDSLEEWAKVFIQDMTTPPY
jgi:hypothetical protein